MRRGRRILKNIDMKRYKKGILSAILPTVILALTFALSSCVKQELPGGGELGEGGPIVTLELVSPGAYFTPHTRATDQEQSDIRKAVVFVFKDDKVVQCIPVPTITDNKMTFSGIKTSQNESDKFDIVVIANHPLDLVEGHDFMGKTREYLSDFFRVSSTSTSINDLRMWGEAREVYVHPISNSFQIKMLRSLARIDLDVSVISMMDAKVYVIGTTNASTAMPLPQNVDLDGSVIAPTIPLGSTSDERSVYTPSDWGTIESEIFVPEGVNSKNDPIKIIIQGVVSMMDKTPNFYRIDICRTDPTKGENVYLDILRNHLYRITVLDRYGPGYLTLEEAISAPPLNNIAVDITAIDQGGSGIVIFDNHSSITLDVHDTHIFGKPNGTALYPIVTVKAILGNGVTTAQVTGPGITTPIQLENNIPKLIEVALPEGIKAGELKITVGRLSYPARFEITQPIDAHFDFMPIVYSSSVTIEKRQPWITMSQSRTYLKSEQHSNQIIVDNGDVVVHFDENISTTDAPRIASVLTQDRNSSYKRRIVFEQLNLKGMVLGLFGGVKDSGGYTSLLACESVEEYDVRDYDYEDDGPTIVPGGLPWGFDGVAVGLTDSLHGRLSTIMLAKTRFEDNGIATSEIDLTLFHNYAARYCYDKNRDTDGSGTLDDNEIVWYLPAKNQLMGAWIAYAGEFTPNLYWSVTESESHSQNSCYVNFINSGGDAGATRDYWKTDIHKVRCVRDL